MKNQIRLGDKVKCKYTGFVGIAIAETKFINGCVQFSVLGKYDKKNLSPDGMLPEMPIDSQSLILIDKKLRVPTPEEVRMANETADELENEGEDEQTGGPARRVGRRNY